MSDDPSVDLQAFTGRFRQPEPRNGAENPRLGGVEDFIALMELVEALSPSWPPPAPVIPIRGRFLL